MTKRTREAADFLRRTITTSTTSSSVTVSKKARDSNGASIPTALNSNYEPNQVASLKQLLQRDGNMKPRTKDLTTFQRRVYAITKRIPAGQVSTYKYVAESLDCPKAYRAVGNALRTNPFAPNVPCHRVLASDGTIGGFAGSVGECPLILRKQSMLQAEGVEFDTTARALRRDASYRSKVILQKIDAKGIDSMLEDDQLMKI